MVPFNLIDFPSELFSDNWNDKKICNTLMINRFGRKLGGGGLKEGEYRFVLLCYIFRQIKDYLNFIR